MFELQTFIDVSRILQNAPSCFTTHAILHYAANSEIRLTRIYPRPRRYDTNTKSMLAIRKLADNTELEFLLNYLLFYDYNYCIDTPVSAVFKYRSSKYPRVFVFPQPLVVEISVDTTNLTNQRPAATAHVTVDLPGF